MGPVIGGLAGAAIGGAATGRAGGALAGAAIGAAGGAIVGAAAAPARMCAPTGSTGAATGFTTAADPIAARPGKAAPAAAFSFASPTCYSPGMVPVWGKLAGAAAMRSRRRAGLRHEPPVHARGPCRDGGRVVAKP